MIQVGQELAPKSDDLTKNETSDTIHVLHVVARSDPGRDVSRFAPPFTPDRPDDEDETMIDRAGPAKSGSEKEADASRFFDLMGLGTPEQRGRELSLTEFPGLDNERPSKTFVIRLSNSSSPAPLAD